MYRFSVYSTPLSNICGAGVKGQGLNQVESSQLGPNLLREGFGPFRDLLERCC
jgi:hypothetical protein